MLPPDKDLFLMLPPLRRGAGGIKKHQVLGSFQNLAAPRTPHLKEKRYNVKDSVKIDLLSTPKATISTRKKPGA